MNDRHQKSWQSRVCSSIFWIITALRSIEIGTEGYNCGLQTFFGNEKGACGITALLSVSVQPERAFYKEASTILRHESALYASLHASESSIEI
uniref:AlNc14C161G7786 protein n=1 Tax=Albugo laibachii Nc14 TaxID=890382 RepID=F0WMV0_9STRA|nr:AlNc14C161G7786 [Albugo laibachii Nc14]|eukprot:CCA22635.1 AlNc14C161G7786 [Albugo laibachii Nc14]